MTRARDGIYRYVPLERAPDYLALGWAFPPRWNLGPVHGHWSVLMFWPCECKLVEPRA